MANEPQVKNDTKTASGANLSLSNLRAAPKPQTQPAEWRADGFKAPAPTIPPLDAVLSAGREVLGINVREERALRISGIAWDKELVCLFAKADDDLSDRKYCVVEKDREDFKQIAVANLGGWANLARTPEKRAEKYTVKSGDHRATMWSTVDVRAESFGGLTLKMIRFNKP